MGGFWSKAAGWLTGLGCLSGGVACCFTGVGIAIGLPMIAAGASIIGSTMYAESSLRNHSQQSHVRAPDMEYLLLQAEDSRRKHSEQLQQVSEQLQELHTQLRRSDRIKRRREALE